MHGRLATRRKTFTIEDLAPPFHSFSTGIEHCLLKSPGRSPVDGAFAKAGVNASRDPAFPRFAGIYLENIPAGYRSLSLSRRGGVHCDERKRLVISVDKYHSRAWRHSSSSNAHFVAVIDKEHAEPRGMYGLYISPRACSWGVTANSASNRHNTRPFASRNTTGVFFSFMRWPGRLR